MTRKNAIGILVSIFITILIAGYTFFRFRSKRTIRNVRYYQDIISEVAETIIPQTDTPGAKRAGVNVYIINVIESCLSVRDQKTILGGLEDVEEYCLKRYSLPFIKCTPEKKISTLEHFRQKGVFENVFLNKVKNKLLGSSFFELIKDLTVTGYCMSEIGAIQGLAYDHTPVTYNACVPLLPDQHSWATA